MAFYVAAVCTCYFLTSTPRTAGARLPLFIGLFILIFLERLVTSWGVTDSQSTDTTVKCAFSKSVAVSMVYTLKDLKNNVQSSSGSEWFQCQVLNILWHNFMVYGRQFFIYNNMEKAWKSTSRIGFIFC